MNRKNFLLIVASLALLVGTVLARGYFLPEENNNNESFSIAPPHLMTPAGAASVHNTEFFTFGDTAGRAIFLNLTSPQFGNDDAPQITLVGTAISGPAPLHSDNRPAHCTASVGLVSPPPGVSLSVQNIGAQQSSWEQVKSWLSSQFNEQYAVTLWSPSSAISTYQLVSMYDMSVGSDCTNLIDEDV